MLGQLLVEGASHLLGHLFVEGTSLTCLVSCWFRGPLSLDLSAVGLVNLILAWSAVGLGNLSHLLGQLLV